MGVKSYLDLAEAQTVGTVAKCSLPCPIWRIMSHLPKQGVLNSESLPRPAGTHGVGLESDAGSWDRTHIDNQATILRGMTDRNEDLGLIALRPCARQWSIEWQPGPGDRSIIVPFDCPHVDLAGFSIVGCHQRKQDAMAAY